MDAVAEREACRRIEQALHAARDTLARFTSGNIAARSKSCGSPVTEADHAVNAALREHLLRPGEGWLSEETEDDRARLGCSRVWIVDPIDGTREFVDGIPEWCVSVALVEGGRPVAGGVCNPAAGDFIIGASSSGVMCNGVPVTISSRTTLGGATVLASRSECDRGEWNGYSGSEFHVKTMGSVAYKLALVAAGRADATWTLQPKHEWDIAGGAALLEAAGGFVCLPDGSPVIFNRPSSIVPGLVAGPQQMREQLLEVIGRCVSRATGAS